jgi:16S rRNA processing protein RimM
VSPGGSTADGPGEGARERVVMAEVGAPHGVRGAVRLNVFAEDPLALRRYNPFTDDAGRTVKIRSLKPIGKGLVAEIEGVDTRDAAEALRGTRLSVPRSRLPRPDEDEFYYVDLVGLEARLVTGEVLGRVRGVADHGAGDVLEVDASPALLVPFTRAVVPTVDVASGFLVIDPPPGLLEPGEPGPGEAEPEEAEPHDEADGGAGGAAG